MIDEIIKTYFDLFIMRDDTYAVQKENMQYSRIEEPIKKTLIKRHLQGDTTIGAYQFNSESKCKWICYDFDGEDLNVELDKAKKLYLKLKFEEKVESVLLEFSGKKGYHVWVFCEEIDGSSAKYWAEEVAKGCDVHEIFPKQREVKDKFGNLVKLPLGIHQGTGKRSVLFDDNFVELDINKSMQYLLKFSKNKKHIIDKIIIKEIIRTVVKIQGKTNIPDYIKNMINTGKKEGERHKSVFILTKELYNAGYSEQEILEQVSIFNKNCSPPQPDYIVESHVKYLLRYPERYLTKEIVTEGVSQEDIERISNVTYANVIEIYKKWIYMKDTVPIDIALATAITRKFAEVPLWFIMIAPSGSGKSEIIKPLEDKTQPSSTEVMSRITPNTFLSGVSKKKEDYIDFAETLSNNPKLFLTFDFAQFAKMDSKDKGQLWAQLRDLYDGFIERKAGLGVSKKVDNIKINWLICTTHVIDSELLAQQELGTRELIYRYPIKEVKEQKLMERVWDNSTKLLEMRKELAFTVRRFIENKESEQIKEIDINDTVKSELMNLAKMISVLRAATESDSYTGELTNFVYPEMPTRILLQLKTLFIGLKNLDSRYSDQKALRVLQDVALSSIHPIRLKIIIKLFKEPNISTTALQKKLSIGYKTINTQLYTAKQLGLVDYTEDENEDQYKQWSKKVWFTTDHDVIKYIKKIKGLETQWNTIFETKNPSL